MNKQSLPIIQSEVKYSDWKFQGFTPIRGTSQNELGDWKAYLPSVELQNLGGTDKMDCVTFSFLNCLETLYNFQTNTKRNFSDRWLAKLSGTTKNGNSMEKVFDTARHYGLVDEELWADSPNFTWNDYYSDIPQNIIDEGKEFLTKWNIYREWVEVEQASIVRALESSPLQATVRYASGDGVLYPQGTPNHAVMICYAELGKYFEIFDSESKTLKKYHWDYPFGAVLKPSLIKKNMFTIKDNQLYLLVQSPEQVLAMGYKNGLLIYDNKVDTLINSASRSQKWQIPTPITLEMYNSVKHYNAKGNEIDT